MEPFRMTMTPGALRRLAEDMGYADTVTVETTSARTRDAMLLAHARDEDHKARPL